MAKLTFTVDIDERFIKAEAMNESKKYVREVLAKEFATFIKERPVRIESAIDSAIREEARHLLKTDAALQGMFTTRINSMPNSEVLAFVDTKRLEDRIDKKIDEAIQRLMASRKQ